MKFNRFYVAIAVSCAMTACFVGCKKNDGSRDGLVPAAGVLLYNGQPVADAEIEMRPATPDQINSVAVGRTDAEGKFELMTDRPGDGAFPGQYKTVVRKQTETIDGKTREELEKEAQTEGKGEVYFDKSKLKIENLLPEKYLDPENTPLIVEIPAKGDKKLTITVED